MEAELKVVIQMKGDRALVGVQGTNTDPVVETLPATSLNDVLSAVPEILARAREKWAATPKNPDYQRPPEPPAPARAAAATRSTPQRPAEPQQRFF